VIRSRHHIIRLTNGLFIFHSNDLLVNSNYSSWSRSRHHVGSWSWSRSKSSNVRANNFTIVEQSNQKSCLFEMNANKSTEFQINVTFRRDQDHGTSWWRDRDHDRILQKLEQITSLIVVMGSLSQNSNFEKFYLFKLLFKSPLAKYSIFFVDIKF